MSLTESTLVLGLGTFNVVFETVVPAKTPFVIAAAVVWLIYIASRVARDPGVLRRWGFRLDSLHTAWRPVAAVTFVGLAGAVTWGMVAGTFPPPPGFWVILLVYPVWGVAQQFLLNAMLLRNLRGLLAERSAIVVATVLFSASHLPDLTVAALVVPAGLAWTWIYLRRPNLWLLGFGHGILGTAVFYLVLGRDPLALLGG